MWLFSISQPYQPEAQTQFIDTPTIFRSNEIVATVKPV